MVNYHDKFCFDGKIAYVVGGVGLIGSEVSKALSSMGAKILILDVKKNHGKLLVEELIHEGYTASYRYFDCANVKELDKNFSAILDKFDCPDVFINCSYPRTEDWGASSFKDITLDSFRNNVDIHMNSYAWLARLAAEAMVKAESSGSIIQLGSIYGMLGQDLTVYEGTDMHENMTYAAIKGSITSLTRQMASYYGQFNIRVNTLCPGGLQGHVAGQGDSQTSKFVEQYSKKTPLKRLGRSDEVASAALFLASDAASYITGTAFMVDGGWTAI